MTVTFMFVHVPLTGWRDLVRVEPYRWVLIAFLWPRARIIVPEGITEPPLLLRVTWKGRAIWKVRL